MNKLIWLVALTTLIFAVAACSDSEKKVIVVGGDQQTTATQSPTATGGVIKERQEYVGVMPKDSSGCNNVCCATCPPTPTATVMAKTPPKVSSQPPPPPPPQPAPSGPSCPETATEVIARGLPALPWVDESSSADVCKWQAHGATIPSFTVPAGVQVDYDGGGFGVYGICEGGFVPGYVGDITARFVFTADSCSSSAPPVQQPAAPGGIDASSLASIASSLGCSVTQDLPPNGKVVSCASAVTFTVPPGFVVVNEQGNKCPEGQEVTVTTFSLYDERY